jgi:chorismate mutase/prephenate dehydratase
MTSTLDEIRKTIEALDDKIHDLLMERANLVVSVSEEKKKKKLPAVLPSIEAKKIRRLLARHNGPLPEEAIVKIWRELLGAAAQLQTDIKISVFSPDGASTWDLAREYFGTVLKMVRVSAPLGCISSVRDDESLFAVLPWPQDGESTPWWQTLVQQDRERISIVAAVPYGFLNDSVPDPNNRALVVGKTPFLSSGTDRSFIAVSVARDVSRTRLIDAFKGLELKVLGISTRGNGDPNESLHLVEVDNYVASDDERLKSFTAKLENMNARTVVVGGYPAPPVYKHVSKKTEPVSSSKTGT